MSRDRTRAREREYRLAPTHGVEFMTQRRCPKCARRLVTSGTGRFWCEGCGFADEQDVSGLRRAGLDYAMPGGWNKEWAWSKEE